MRRRQFITAGSLTCAGLALARCSTGPASDAPASGPVVISTWKFGRTANEETYRRLGAGESVLEAAQQGVMLIEADPEITSVGIGGYPNSEGVVELDAAIMDGRTLDAGSVASLRDFKNPVAVARSVMDDTPHVLLVGEGARSFALHQGFEPEELLTAASREAWEQFRAEQRQPEGGNHDTIGLVARGADGRMAAACSTSGLAWKLPGRVGDSPLVGHGLYCDDQAGGAAATGVGEEVIKVCGCYQVVEFMRQGMEPEQAARRVLQRILRRERSGQPPSVSFVALRADGRVGYASILPKFQASVSRDGRHEVLDCQALVEKVAS